VSVKESADRRSDEASAVSIVVSLPGKRYENPKNNSAINQSVDTRILIKDVYLR
jgi:hypothetical protein